MTNILLDIALRSTTIYIVVLIGIRLLGKKHVAQLSILDLVLILLISNSVQNAMVGPDSSLLGGIVAAVSLLLVNYILTKVIYRYRRVETAFEGVPTLLVHEGKVLHPHMQSEQITEEELERAIREHGIASVSEVKTAIM